MIDRKSLSIVFFVAVVLIGALLANRRSPEPQPVTSLITEAPKTTAKGVNQRANEILEERKSTDETVWSQ